MDDALAATGESKASPDAVASAVNAAAHTVLSRLFPQQRSLFDGWLEQSEPASPTTQAARQDVSAVDGEPAPEGAPSGQQANGTVDRGLDIPFPPEVNGSTGVDGPGVDRAEPQGVSSTADVSGAVVREWNESALQAIRSSKPVPTVITRALHLLHAAIYDVWAAYQPNAQGAYSQISRNPATGSAGVESAISHAAHAVLSRLFPEQQDLFDGLLAQFAAGPEETSAARLGTEVAEAVLEARANDGSNAADNYTDSSGYTSVNDQDSVLVDPNRWTPLKVPTGAVLDANGTPMVSDDPASFTLQAPLTPHWGDVAPFAIASGDAYRPVAPPQLGDFSPYEDALGQQSTNDAAYRDQFSALVDISADLTPAQKATAEYWADGPQSSTPPGHWNEFAQDIAAREQYGLDDAVKLFFSLNNALFDTGIAIWDAKYAHDFVRPQTAIRHLFAGDEITAWAGPNQGSQLIPGESWRPYQDVTFVTPAFPEYTSGHSGFSFAAATVLEAYTGSDVLFDGQSRGVRDLDGDGALDLIGRWSTDQLTFETYDGEPIVLQWDTVWDAAAEAGVSRLYGGIHIQDGDLRGRLMGQQVAEAVWEQTQQLFSV